MSERQPPNDGASACCGPTRPRDPKAAIETAASPLSPLARPSEGNPRTRHYEASGMVALPGGRFTMGTDETIGFAADGETPARQVRMAPFQIDPCSVSNAQFSIFVRQSGYVTDAERYGWSFVFHLLATPQAARLTEDAVAGAEWWLPVRGATWLAPHGPGSTADDRPDHPVVHVSWNDARAYCDWASKRLPTEAEWEYAAHGGLDGARYPWGNELRPRGQWRCNIWQGRFPTINTSEDGYLGTAPVKSYQPNAYGLFNMVGNVWEWCADWFSVDHGDGPTTGGDEKVIKGGSYLCHDSYCNRYRCAARTKNTTDSSTGNMGFRCARDL
jgi:sulfatase modifying factor 1